MRFYSSFSGDRKKRCRTDKLSKIKASGFILLARRRTRVRRVAKFGRSIKYNFFINFRFSVFFKGSIGLLNLQNPLLYSILYGLRFFYIPFFIFISQYHIANQLYRQILLRWCILILQVLLMQFYFSCRYGNTQV